MDRVDTALMLAMVCVITGTLLTWFNRPIWWMLHKRGPSGSRHAPRYYELLLRVSGICLLMIAACVIGLSVAGVFPFE